MSPPTKAQIFAFGRNIVSGIGPVVALAVAFGALTPDQQHQIATSVDHITAGLKETWGGVVGLGFIIPLVAGWWAHLSSTPKAQVQAAQAAVNSGAVKDVAIIPTGPASPINNPAGDVTKVASALGVPAKPL